MIYEFISPYGSAKNCYACFRYIHELTHSIIRVKQISILFNSRMIKFCFFQLFQFPFIYVTN